MPLSSEIDDNVTFYGSSTLQSWDGGNGSRREGVGATDGPYAVSGWLALCKSLWRRHDIRGSKKKKRKYNILAIMNGSIKHVARVQAMKNCVVHRYN